MSITEYEAEVWQEGVMVASVWGTDLARVQSEAMHYAFMYAQDGPEVTIKGLPAECFEEGKS